MSTSPSQDLTKEALSRLLEYIPDARQEAPTKLIVKDIVHGPEIGESLKEQYHNLIRRHTRASLLLAAKQIRLKLDNTVENVPLALAIIHKIKSHLPEECGICKDIYVVPLRESPFRRNNYCHSCGQGSHDCNQEVDVFRAISDINNDYLKSARLRWLCSSCDVSLHWQNNSIQNKFKIFYTGNKTYEDAIKTTNDSIINQLNNTTNITTNSFQGLTTFAIPNGNTTPAATTLPAPSQPNLTLISTPNPLTHPPVLPNSNIPTSTPNPPTAHGPSLPPTNNPIPPNYNDVKKFPNMNKDKICNFLTKGKCRFGAKGENHLGKCDKYHPNQCPIYNRNGSTENGCKNGNRCSEWHATYMCRSSANSRTCVRPECPFKHHKNCTVARNDNNFLGNQQPAHMRPRQYLGPNYPVFNHRQPHYQQRGQMFPIPNRRQSFHQHQFPNQSPQVPQDHLIYMIRTIIQEENNYRYQTQM